MMNSRNSKLLSKMTAICGAALLIGTVGVSYGDELPGNHIRRTINHGAFPPPQMHVDAGSEQAAIDYYTNIVSGQTKLPFATPLENTSIRTLLDYLGYPALTAIQLHGLSSADLMALGSSGEILATRFFAPKITDVAEKPQPVPSGGFGWRKLVLLKARAGSAAAANKIGSLHILQNIFEDSANGDPFDTDKNVSLFNQAILVREIGTGPYTTNRRGAYFFTYGPFVKVKENAAGEIRPDKPEGKFQEGGSLIYNLKATFDELDRDPETNSDGQDYFVPESCQQCHGGSRQKPKLNYLDTDHWIDRVFPNYNLAGQPFDIDDFTSLKSSSFGLIYDGGKDVATQKFKNAFEIIRKINLQIAAQNREVGGLSNFQLAAAEKWLDLHAASASGENHVPPPERGFGSPTWDPSNEDDRKLVYYLNRYCYRCHSSIRFNVFDRKGIKLRASNIEQRVENISQPDRWMPQDRIFPGLVTSQGIVDTEGQLREFLDLIGKLE